MTDSKENTKKQEPTSEGSSEDDKTKAFKESTKRKGRLKFKEEDMIKIKYNF